MFEVHFEERPTPYKVKNPSEILSSLAEFTYDPSELADHDELPDLEVRRLGKQGLKRNDPSNMADRDSLLDSEVCK